MNIGIACQDVDTNVDLKRLYEKLRKKRDIVCKCTCDYLESFNNPIINKTKTVIT